MPEKFNELLLKPDIIELYNSGITPDYGYLMNGRFEKDMIKTLYPLKTLSGNPITWETSNTEYLFPVVSFEPKQAGSGDPSPENVRPISGWNEVRVTRRGKNLVGADSHTKAYATWAINNGVLLSTDIEDSAQSEDKMYICGCYPNTEQAWDSIFDACDIMVRPVNAGNPSVPYEPYRGETSTLALPETIYGGTVDVVTGVGSKTWGYIASYNGESLPGEWISDRDVYSAGASPTTGAQVAYQLATPEPFQATGNQALTIQPGKHTIFTVGESMILNRKARRLEV